MAKVKKSASDINAIVVFFDIDGVLGDFDNHAKAQGKEHPDGRKNYDAMDEQWWATMPVTDGAREMVKAVRTLADEVRFLTGPVPHTSCYGGKAKWVESFFSAEMNRFKSLPHLIICPAKDKAFLAGPKRILVDDSAENVENWRAAGGIAIHHTGDATDTLNALKNILLRLKPAPAPAPSGPDMMLP